MRVRKLDVGLEAISRWREIDEVHLPTTGRLGPTFLPTRSLLDEVIRRPSLDERLVNLMQPQNLDPELLEASVLAETRREVLNFFMAASGGAFGNPEMADAAMILDEEVELDDVVCTALAALLRG